MSNVITYWSSFHDGSCGLRWKYYYRFSPRSIPCDYDVVLIELFENFLTLLTTEPFKYRCRLFRAYTEQTLSAKLPSQYLLYSFEVNRRFILYESRQIKSVSVYTTEQVLTAVTIYLLGWQEKLGGGNRRRRLIAPLYLICSLIRVLNARRCRHYSFGWKSSFEQIALRAMNLFNTSRCRTPYFANLLTKPFSLWGSEIAR